MISMFYLPCVCETDVNVTLIMNILKFKAVNDGGGGGEEEEAVADIMAISAMLPQNPAVFLGMAQGGGLPQGKQEGAKGPLVCSLLSLPSKTELKLPDDLGCWNSFPLFHL